MNKLLLEINCPSTGKTYDFWIAKKMVVDDVITNLAEKIQYCENNNTLFSNTRDLILFKPPKYILDRKTSLTNLGIKSGDTLVLI